ncbi:MAG: LysR family transcriptional regulator [Hydrogenophaga sp.]|uniref:LysR family transcriptional regulator n=1 Tax=Hydrogenophaga sp. TaxID=1904254 RepID=UPI001D567DC2|nr:LysR family transcriptional regulator [Hydrogenophaga sp.]MBX3608733.1 LysR family transcriptional regulator [Hydrogenophaga sp.]
MARPHVTLDQWAALVAVVQAGTHARAAEQLHRSQSSVTYAVQQIESLLGVKAFELQGRKAVLTAAGQQLYRRARFLVEEALAIETASARLSLGWEAELRLAVEVVYPHQRLFDCLARFSEEAPHTRIEVVEAVLGHRTSLLEQRAIDLAIYGTTPSGYEGERLMQVCFRLVAHPDHPLHQLGRPITARDLRQHRHLVVRESSPERSSEPSMQVPQRWTVGHLSTSIEAVRRGYGFAWLPEEHIQEELRSGQLKPVPMRRGGERFADLYLVFADRDNAGPGARRLAQLLAENAHGQA